MENESMQLVEENKRQSYHTLPAVKTKKITSITKRFADQKIVFNRCKIVSVLSLLLALTGLGFMIANNEIHLYNNSKVDYPINDIMEWSMTVSTIILLGVLIWYHILQIKLQMLRKCVSHWGMAIPKSYLIYIILELIVCAIHPIPIAYDGDEKILQKKENYLGMEEVLSFAMFLRLFLVFRVMLLFDSLYNDAAAQSLSALVQIKFNVKFMIKGIMNRNPEMFLVTLIFTGLMASSWIFRACEIFNEGVDRNMLNAIWAMFITFLTVGYGDISPETLCGRTVAICTGIFGAGCTALIIAVITNNLEQSPSEKYFHRFISQVSMEKRYKELSALVIQYCWKIYRSKKFNKTGEAKKYTHLLMGAIHEMREIKDQRGGDFDNTLTIHEMHRNNVFMDKKVDRLSSNQNEMKQSFDGFEDKMKALDVKIDKLHSLLEANIEKDRIEETKIEEAKIE